MPSPKRSDEFAAAIRALITLIDSGTASEAAYQKWFESHSVAWQALGYTRAFAHPELVDEVGKKLIPDFLAERHDELADVIDLKTPGMKLTANTRTPRERNSAALAMAEAQLSEYSEFFEPEAHRRRILEDTGYRVPKDPNLVLIGGAGVDMAQSLHKIARRYSKRIRVHTYPDVLQALNARYSQEHPQPDGLRYFGFNSTLAISRYPSTSDRAFIFDHGISRGRNRIALQVDTLGRLRLSVVDNTGRILETTAQASLQLDRWYNIWFEISRSKVGISCSIRVDGETIGHAEVWESFDISFTPIQDGRFTMGASLDGTQGAAFATDRYGFVERPPTMIELAQINNVTAQKLAHGTLDGSRVHFDAAHFLERGELQDNLPTVL